MARTAGLVLCDMCASLRMLDSTVVTKWHNTILAVEKSSTSQ